MNMNRVAITGGAGFIGLHLARDLAGLGARVDLIDDLSRGARDADLEAALALPGVRLVARDLTRSGALDDLGDGYDAIFHFAALVGVANVGRRPYEVLTRNVAMTVAALGLAARQRALRRFVFASTSEVYAPALAEGRLAVPTPEDAPLALPDLGRPRASYLLSKLYGEALCRHAGVPVTIVRPHNVYGPRMGLAHVVPELLQRAHAAPVGGRLDVYSVEHTRTFCFVDDAVELIRRAAAAPEAAWATLNVGAPAPEVTIGTLAEAIVAVVGKPLSIVPRPPAEGSPARRCPDMTRSTAITGYRARVALADGLARTYAWYRAHAFADAAQAAAGG